MKHSDRPIYRPKDDLLGRARFSLSLARAIDNLSLARDGFVIAVMGEWGSGKSSVVEMTCRYLTHLEMERLNSPASKQTLESLEALAEQFDRIKHKVAEFDELHLNVSIAGAPYRRSLFRSWLDSENEASQADQYLMLLLQVQQAPRTIQVRFSPWLIAGRAQLATAFLSELARALGEKLGSEVRVAFAKLLERYSELAPIAGAGLDLITGTGIGKLFSSGTALSTKVATRLTSGPTLDELLGRLRRALRKLPNQRVLVVIDDLDRLTPGEAVEMISLVKSLGDLPNVVYLLSFDQRNLVKLLTEGTKLDGAEYMNKIVQYPVHLPPILGKGLARLLDADLREILGALDDSESRRLGVTWHFVFRHYLKTPRDVRLYANSIAVSMSSLRDFVDPIDLLLLELLRLHEPELYSWLRENLQAAKDISLLTDVVRTLVGDATPEGVKHRADKPEFGDEGASIRRLMADRVSNTIKNEDIWNQARPANLLWFWWGSGAEKEVKEFTDRAMTSPVGLRGLLQTIPSMVRSTAGDYEQVSRSWDKIVNLDALTKRAQNLATSAKVDNDVRLARRFLDALEKGHEDPF